MLSEIQEVRGVLQQVSVIKWRYGKLAPLGKRE